MSFYVYHRWGASERDLLESAFPALLDELDAHPEDQEHASVSVIHESEWGLNVSRGGYVVFENVEGEGEPRHMVGVPHEKQLGLMALLALDALNREPWQAGY